MQSVWTSLIWKEWHEHKWKLAAIVAVLVGATSLVMLVPERDKFEAAWGMAFACVIPLAIFIGLGVAAGERSRGTMAFLQAQPISLRQVAIVKLTAGILTLVAAVFATALFLFMSQHLFDLFGVRYSSDAFASAGQPVFTGNYYVDLAIFCVIIATSLVIWTAATGLNRKDEVSAAAAALVITIGWTLFVLLMGWLFVDPQEIVSAWFALVVFATLPCGFVWMFAPDFTSAQVAFGISASTITHGLLAAFYISRFGQIKERPITSPKPAVRETARREWLGPPRTSPIAAVAWKQFRESVPIAVIGLATIIGVTLLVDLPRYDSRFADVLAQVAGPLGCCIAVVVGIGVALQDVTPHHNAFWRSRPIDGTLWFCTKFVTGLLVMLVILYLPQLVIIGFGASHSVPDLLATFVLLYLPIYAAAVAMTTIVRHAVYAAILSLGAVTGFVVAARIAWMIPRWAGMIEPPTGGISLGNSLEFSTIVTGLIACFIASTVAGWLATRNDWGWKGRY